MKKFKIFVEAKDWKAQPEEHQSIFHHITNIKFKGAFHPLTHFGTSQTARARTAAGEMLDNLSRVSPTKRHKKNEYDHYAVRIKMGNNIKLNDDIGIHTAGELADQLRREGHISLKDQQHVNSATEHYNAVKRLHGILKKRNIDTISYTNEVEDKGKDSHMVVDPKNSVRIISKRHIKHINNTRAQKDIN